jgi:hypothetical protein
MTIEHEGMQKRLRFDVILAVLLTAAVSVGITSWWFGKQLAEARLNAAVEAEIGEKSAKAIRAWNRLKQHWNADDDWESQLSKNAPSSSVDVEHAMVKGRPILILGKINDVVTNQDSDGATVLIENHLTQEKYFLRFSLAASSGVAKSMEASTQKEIVSKLDSFILVANIQSVTRTQDTNDQGYFLAHGTLLEEYPAEMILIGPEPLRLEQGTKKE